MVLLDTPFSHGPHVWYASVCWWYQGHYRDLFRIKEHRPDGNVIHGRNSYSFKSVAEIVLYQNMEAQCTT